METFEALHWTRQQQQKIGIDSEQQLYTPKIEDIATAVIEMVLRALLRKQIDFGWRPEEVWQEDTVKLCHNYLDKARHPGCGKLSELCKVHDTEGGLVAAGNITLNISGKSIFLLRQWNLLDRIDSVLRTCKKTSTYVFPRDAAERDLGCTGESVVILNSVCMDIKTWWQR
ncbi:hypothetical protein LAZ67_2005179 [Cordylochernes scorpioides]|uniref:Uncharacterized protein n=1 Tax=Cordylochernes scorpioides TaxID=51811 RepID=A0ABY6K7E4_9ARAC|nr:hypothetical protein LAZ67_2005179 [Cordylochernes scorpioides]